MPRDFPTPVAPSIAGTTVAFTAVSANNDAVRPNQAVWVRNGGGVSLTVTLETAGTAEGNAIADPTVVIPAGQDRLIGPFTRIFPQTGGTDEGYVYVNYSVTASVTRAVLSNW